MDAETFKEFGKAAIDFIADYKENIRDCDVLPSVSPGYLLDALPDEMPEKSQQWQDVLEDVNKLIKPGITHWQSPNFHAYYPAGCSYPSIVGDMLAAGFSVIGFNWLGSPACTELEVVVMDWLAKFFKLPEHFLHSSKGPGGGIIQGSASESILVAIIAAREQAVRRVKAASPHLNEGEIRSRLVAYSSDQSNSCIEKSCILATVPVRLLTADKNQRITDKQLAKAIEEDLAKGLIPIICIATIGTTGTCAHDDIETLADVCESNNIWLHVDAAYAGALMALDEYAHLRRGLDRVDSLNYNLHKSLLINFDCTAMWFRDPNLFAESCNVNRIYLETNVEGQRNIPEFRHWQIPLGRRFRALKVWVTFRIYGAEGLRNHIRTHIRLAERFEQYILADPRFELVAKRELGLVCFRVKGENQLTVDLLQRIVERKKIYMVQANFDGKHFMRFAVCGTHPKEEDMDFAWHEIEGQLSELLSEQKTNGVVGVKKDLAQSNETKTESKHVDTEGQQTYFTDVLDAISQQLRSGLHINFRKEEKSK